MITVIIEKTVWGFLKILRIELLYAPTIPLQGMYPEKTTIERNTCTPIFIAQYFL